MQQGGSESHRRSPLKAVLRGLTALSSGRPSLVLGLVALLTIAAVGWTAWKIEFKTKRADLIDPRAEFHQRWIEYTESFGDATDIVIVVEGERPEAIRDVLEDLGSQLVHTRDLFSNVLYKIDPRELRSKGLQYLSPQQLQVLSARLDQLQPVVSGNWSAAQLQSVATNLRRQLDAGYSRPETAEPLLEHSDLLTTSLAQAIGESGTFQSPWPNLAARNRRIREVLRPTTYLINDRGTMGLIKARPALDRDTFNGPARAIKRLNELIADVKANHQDTTITVTGIPILEHDEMQRSQMDMLKASALSFAGVGLLLLLGFRGLRHPLLALVTLGVGIAWSFGYTTLAIGHLNIVSISFAVMLIALAIDYAIVYTARYLQLRHEGQDLKPALLDASAEVGPGIVAAALTTALAFFCATMTDFLGVAELGMITGGGILICILATFILLPALIAWADHDVKADRLPRPYQVDFLRKLTVNRPIWVMLFCFLMIAAAGTQTVQLVGGKIVPRVRYDYNLLNLQAEGVESVEAQQRIFEKSDQSLLFAVSLADSPEEARELNRRFAALPSVARVEDLGSRLPAWPLEQTRPLIQSVASRLTRLPGEVPPLSRTSPVNVGRAIEGLYQIVREGRTPIEERIRTSIDSFLDQFERLSQTQQSEFIAQYEYRMATSLLRQLQALAAATNLERLTYADIPPELASRYVSAEGRWLVQVYPKESIWDVEPLERFVQDVRSVDPDATGTPLENYEASKQIIGSYETAAIYALVVIGLVLLFDFIARQHKLLILLPPAAIIIFAVLTWEMKVSEMNWMLIASIYIALATLLGAMVDAENLRDALLSLVPAIGGAILMLGIMGLLKLNLNPANLIVLPLILALGVEGGVHVVHDFREQGKSYCMSPSTMNALILSALTTMTGFGSMMLAAHRGLFSVGLVLTIGVGSCLFVTAIMLPAMLSVMSGKDTPPQAAVHRQPAADKQVKARAA